MESSTTRGPAFALALTAWACCAAGCQGGPRECWGDCAKPGVVVLGMRDEQGKFVEVNDGDAVDLVLPIQGGRILFTAARITNFEKQGVVLLGEVRNPDTGALVAQEQRKLDFPVAAGGGYGEPDLSQSSNAANVAVCPNYLSRDIVGQPWQLDVTVTDSRQQPVKVSRRVVPACRHPDPTIRAGCLCECLGCFDLGKCTSGAQPVGCDGG